MGTLRALVEMAAMKLSDNGWSQENDCLIAAIDTLNVQLENELLDSKKPLGGLSK